MPRRAGIWYRAHPLFQSPKAQVRHHMRHACPPRSRPTTTYPPRHGAQRPAEHIIRKAYHLFFDRFAPNPAKVSARFVALGFDQPLRLHVSGPEEGILLWPRPNA